MNLPDLESLNRRTLTVMFNNNSITVEKSNENESDELVLNALKIALNQKNTPTSTPQSKIDFKTNFKEFLENKIKMGKVKIGTIKSYENTYNIFLKNQENKNLVEYKLKDFENFRDSLKISGKTINGHLVNLKMFFEYGQKQEYIEKNPLEYIEYLKETKSTKENFTNDEIKELLTTTKIKQEYKDLIRFSAYSAMRIEEIIKLEKIENEKIEIKQGKTENSKRVIPLHNKIKDLQDLEFLKIIKSNIKVTQKTNERDRLVLGITKNVNRQLQNVIKNKNKTFHCLRATAIEKMMNGKNADIILIKNLVGHSQGANSLTISTYGKDKFDIEKLAEQIKNIEYN